jgi:hypothetical protein
MFSVFVSHIAECQNRHPGKSLDESTIRAYLNLPASGNTNNNLHSFPGVQQNNGPIPGKCKGIIGSGNNKGSPCNKTPKPGMDYCHQHMKNQMVPSNTSNVINMNPNLFSQSNYNPLQPQQFQQPPQQFQQPPQQFQQPDMRNTIKPGDNPFMQQMQNHNLVNNLNKITVRGFELFKNDNSGLLYIDHSNDYLVLGVCRNNGIYKLTDAEKINFPNTKFANDMIISQYASVFGDNVFSDNSNLQQQFQQNNTQQNQNGLIQSNDLFSNQLSQQQVQQQSNPFGQPPQQAPQPNGQPPQQQQPNPFGQPPQTNPFGQPPQPNGQPPQQQQPNPFRQQQQQAPQPNPFGQQQQPPQQQAPQPNPFGQPPQQQASQQQAPQSNPFGQQQQQAPQPNPFGQQEQQQSQSGNHQQDQNQQQPQLSNPFDKAQQQETQLNNQFSQLPDISNDNQQYIQNANKVNTQEEMMNSIINNMASTTI